MFCKLDSECSDGNYCNKDKRTCDYKREGGKSCKKNEDCYTNHCSVDRGNIGTCLHFEYVYDSLTNIDCKDDTNCNIGYYCNKAQGALPRKGKCSRKLPYGAFCSDSNKCIESTYCNATTGKCDRLSNDSVCVTDTECISGYCNSEKKCGVKLPDNSVCVTNTDCVSGYCNSEKKCDVKLPDNSVCVTDTECISGYCREKKCGKLPDNSVCVTDTECISGYCDCSSGQCICQPAISYG